jgi:hypothetical protein
MKLSLFDSFLHILYILDILIIMGSKNDLQNILLTWPKAFINDTDLLILLNCSPNARYSLIKRAMQSGWLIQLKKGFYLIGKPYKASHPNLFEIAPLLYGPSYISLESALSYHQWIPEAVYTTTCATIQRAKRFKTAVGLFSFMRVPTPHFYLGVDRIESTNGIFLLASPWRALADYVYIYKKLWGKRSDMALDLRIESDSLLTSDEALLKELSEKYPSVRVRAQLKILLEIAT